MQIFLRSCRRCFCQRSWLMAALFGVALTGCSGGNNEPNDPNGTRESISIGIPKEPLGTLVIIAQEKGFFADAGLDVNVVSTYPSGKRALQGMLDGEVDLTISSEVPLVFRSFERIDFRILATIGTSANEPRVIARKDKGVEEPTDLHGKKLATQRASAVHYFLHLLLLKNGIEDAKVEFMKAEELPQALADGKIDAFSMREPFIGKAKQLLGDNAIVFEEPGMYLKTMNLVGLSQLVSERPATIEKVLRALERAEEYYREHRDEVLKFVGKKLQVEGGQLGQLLDDVELEVTLSHALVVALEDEARWAIDNAFTENQDTADFQKLISADAMRKVKPAAVTVID